jgi:septum site-determining protein MinD
LIEAQCHPQLIVNRVQRHLLDSGDIASPQALAMGLDLPLAGIVEENSAVYTGMLKGKTAVEDAPETVVQNFQDILSRLEGAQLPVKPLEKETRLRRLLRKVSQKL